MALFRDVVTCLQSKREDEFVYAIAKDLKPFGRHGYLIKSAGIT